MSKPHKLWQIKSKREWDAKGSSLASLFLYEIEVYYEEDQSNFSSGRTYKTKTESSSVLSCQHKNIALRTKFIILK